eukprot:scaffold35276_cov101-Isochrysis_galbana.AAC.1
MRGPYYGERSTAVAGVYDCSWRGSPSSLLASVWSPWDLEPVLAVDELARARHSGLDGAADLVENAHGTHWPKTKRGGGQVGKK